MITEVWSLSLNTLRKFCKFLLLLNLAIYVPLPITVILNGLPWKRTEIILSFLSLHPRLRCCFLTVPPFVWHPLCSVINKCLSLPLGTQGKVNEAEWSILLIINKLGTQKGLCAHSIFMPRILSSMLFLPYFICQSKHLIVGSPDPWVRETDARWEKLWDSVLCFHHLCCVICFGQWGIENACN